MARAENLVIMFTDIVGFTEMMSTQSREENDTMLSQSESLLLGVAKKFGGKHIKSIGDALLLIFKSPTDSVHCAMAMHDALWERNQGMPSEREKISIRVSLNSGEVQIKGGDVFGEPVNVAARLEAMTPANEVYFSEAIYLSMNKAEVPHELVGRYELRGIPEEVTIYRVPRGASAHRLVAVGSEDEIENQYPFGGMHRAQVSQASKFVSNFPVKKTLIGVLIASVLAVVISALLWWPSDDQYRAELEDLLDSNNLIALENRLTEVLADDPDEALALFMQGHVNFEKRRHKAALENYQQAISKQADLANDERYAKNLIRALSSNGSKVTELAKLSVTKPVLDELAGRSIRPGTKGRRDAAYILASLNRTDRVDSVAKAILDLQESTSCEDKKSALQILKKHKDVRALPALQEITGGSMVSRLKRNCYMKEAKAAVAAIEG